ncbi:MAG: ABC transporter substrate-binding protein, partial [Streptomycetaceae bacterium]|nr:ABC transporter substrate-binding protein [Streptomycetaceae bacterium]
GGPPRYPYGYAPPPPAQPPPPAGLSRRRLLAGGSAAVVALAGGGAAYLLLRDSGDGSSPQSHGDTPGTGTSTGTTPAPTGSPGNPGVQLPARYLQAGVINVGIDASYPPNEFRDVDGKTVIGATPDLANALARVLGVGFVFQNSPFDTLLPGLRATRFDLVMSSVTDTKDRQLQSQVDFVDYLTIGSTILVKKGNPKGVRSLDGMCGRTLAVRRGTPEEDVAGRQKSQCDAQGVPLVYAPYLDQEAALAALRQGGADACLFDLPTAVYVAQPKAAAAAEFELVGDQIAPAPVGIAVRKEDAQLRDAIRLALQQVRRTGEYQRILDTWGLAATAITDVTVNAGA